MKKPPRLVTATLVPWSERGGTFETYFGIPRCIDAERLLYTYAQRYIRGYQGGLWDFYQLSNGGFYAVLKTEESRLRVINPQNHYDGTMTPDAAGLALMVMVSNHLSLQFNSVEIDRLYKKIMAFAERHKESHAILAFLD